MASIFHEKLYQLVEALDDAIFTMTYSAAHSEVWSKGRSRPPQCSQELSRYEAGLEGFWQMIYFFFTLVPRVYLFRVPTKRPGWSPGSPPALPAYFLLTGLPKFCSNPLLHSSFLIRNVTGKSSTHCWACCSASPSPWDHFPHDPSSLVYLWHLQTPRFSPAFLSLLSWRISLKQTSLQRGKGWPYFQSTL